KWSHVRGRGKAGGFSGPIEELPELMDACQGDQSVLAAIVGQELQPAQVAQVWSHLSLLPVLEVELSVKGWWEESQEQLERRLPPAGAHPREQSSWLDVQADQEYVLQVALRRLHPGQQKRRDGRAQAPRFPKLKDEGWFLVLGEVEHRQLLALKRLGHVQARSSTALAFYTPERTGR
ncbi:unnamed protein product, partial [Tetraodon nigroviridis]